MSGWWCTSHTPRSVDSWHQRRSLEDISCSDLPVYTVHETGLWRKLPAETSHTLLFRYISTPWTWWTEPSFLRRQTHVRLKKHSFWEKCQNLEFQTSLRWMLCRYTAENWMSSVSLARFPCLWSSCFIHLLTSLAGCTSSRVKCYALSAVLYIIASSSRRWAWFRATHDGNWFSSRSPHLRPCLLWVFIKFKLRLKSTVMLLWVLTYIDDNKTLQEMRETEAESRKNHRVSTQRKSNFCCTKTIYYFYIWRIKSITVSVTITLFGLALRKLCVTIAASVIW